jgi:hypothetical protein
VSLLTISSHKVRKDALHLPSPLRCFTPSNSTPKTNLAMTKPYVGLSINQLNTLYVITLPLLMSKKPVYPVVLLIKTSMSTRSSLTHSLRGLLVSLPSSLINFSTVLTLQLMDFPVFSPLSYSVSFVSRDLGAGPAQLTA